MGGGGQTTSTTDKTIASFRIQSSVAGATIPLLYGRTRVPANLFAYDDFRAIPHTTTTGGGGKGAAGGTQTKNTSFTYTASVMMGLGEGPFRAILRGWRGKSIYGAVDVNSSTDLATELVTVSNSNGDYTVALAAVYAGNVDVVYMGTDALEDLHIYPGSTLLNGPNMHYTQDAFGNYNFAAQFRDVPLQIRYLVSDPTAQPSALPALGLSFAPGYDAQPIWGYLLSQHPDEAVGYSGTSYLYSAAYDLGSDAELGNHNFEVRSFTEFSDTIHDADPSVIIADFMSNGRYGVPDAPALGNLAAFSNYAIAQGLFLSPAIDTQQSAAEWLTYLLGLVNTDVVWSAGVLKFVPLGDAEVSANGQSFVPDTVPQYDLTTDHFLSDGSGPPIKVSRISPTDIYNHVQLEIFDRDDNYNVAIVEAKDAADIDERGLRTQDVTQAHAICDQAVGRMAAQLILQQQLAVRATYTFILPWTFGRLEPLDLVTLTEPMMGLLRWPVRISTITENDDNSFEIVAEDAPIGMASAPAYGTQAGTGFAHDYNVDPGDVTAPVFFEPPIELTTSGLEVWVAASGRSPYWGGFEVWVSLDAETYRKEAVVFGGSRYGRTTAATGTTDADTLAIALTGLGGTILPASAADASHDQAPFFVGTRAGGEFIGYEGATLTGANAYSMTPLHRGRYGSNAQNWPAGTDVVRVDDGIGKSGPLALSLVGQQVSVKLCSFNVYGGGTQSIADVERYTYTITGAMLKLPPSDVTGLTTAFEKFAIRISWTGIADQDLADYEIRVDGTSWETATFLARASGTSYSWTPQLINGTRKIWVKARDIYGNDSRDAAELDLIIPPPTASNVMARIVGPDVQLNWTAVAGAYAIDHYLVSMGPDTATQTVLDAPRTTRFEQRIAFVGAQFFGVAGVDAAGNVGPVVFTQVDVAAPGAIIPGNASHAPSEVIDNNVLLYWTPPATGSLPIDRYLVRKGATFAGGAPEGSNGPATFVTLFEQVSGAFTYWIAAVDTAGNQGPATAIAAAVNQPPDYVLQSSIDSTFAGTLVGMYLEGGKMYGPSLGETVQTHFESRSWTSVADQIAGGYPYFFQPSGASGSYEELIDYGAVLASTTLTATLVANQIFGATAVVAQISYKANLGDPWTLCPAGATTALVTNFRYVLVHFDFTASGGDDLLEVVSLNVKLSIRYRRDRGSFTALAADSGGTWVPFNQTFVDTETPQLQVNATTAVTGIVNFLDAPYPTGFYVLLFDSSGTRIDGSGGWTVDGF